MRLLRDDVAVLLVVFVVARICRFGAVGTLNSSPSSPSSSRSSSPSASSDAVGIVVLMMIAVGQDPIGVVGQIQRLSQVSGYKVASYMVESFAKYLKEPLP